MFRVGPFGISRPASSAAANLSSSGATELVTIGMNYSVLNGKEAIFEKAFSNVVHAMRGLAGHQRTRMYRDINNPQEYLIISEWSDKGSFDAFIASDAFRNVANWGKEQILAGRPRHEVYTTAESAARPGAS
jgi:heme-degrading monooxygenase HmoA